MQDQTKIKLYGANWCGDCIRSKFILTTHSIPYDYIDIDTDDEAIAFVEKVNNGVRSIPVLVFPDGTTLTEPNNEQLVHKLESLGLL